MAQTISTAKFISRSKSYVKAAIAKANANGNKTLSLAEAKKLPKDLQDNFANFRKNVAKGGTVDAKEFEQRYGQYVSQTAQKADIDGDGQLSRTEATILPSDLEDNFNIYWNATVPGADKPLQTEKQRIDAIYNRQLPASNAFGAIAKALDVQLGDNNIMSGVVGLASGKLDEPMPTKEHFEEWGKALMADYLLETDGLVASSVKVEHLNPQDTLKRAAQIIAEGNAYTPNADILKDIIDGQGPKSDPDRQIGLKEVNEALKSSVTTLIVTGKVKDQNGYPGPNTVGMAIFLGASNGQFVAYYGREGHV